MCFPAWIAAFYLQFGQEGNRFGGAAGLQCNSRGSDDLEVGLRRQRIVLPAANHQDAGSLNAAGGVVKECGLAALGINVVVLEQFAQLAPAGLVQTLGGGRQTTGRGNAHDDAGSAQLVRIADFDIEVHEHSLVGICDRDAGLLGWDKFNRLASDLKSAPAGFLIFHAN